MVATRSSTISPLSDAGRQSSRHHWKLLLVQGSHRLIIQIEMRAFTSSGATAVSLCEPRPKLSSLSIRPVRPRSGKPSEAWRLSNDDLFRSKTVLWQAAKSDRTRTQQSITESSEGAPG